MLPDHLQMNLEDHVKKSLLLAIGALLLLAGCGSADNAPGIPVGPKWKGEPYRIAFATKAPKPNPAGLTIPAITFKANPDALETRAILVMQFMAPGLAGAEPTKQTMIGTPVDIKGDDSALPDDYMERASKGLAEYLGAYCVKGNVHLSVAMARSSLNPHAKDAEVDAKRLSDWLPIDLTFKNPHPTKCK
jgi:hypothetical protein